MTTPIRIIIADDHAMFRHGLRLVLDLEPDVEIVGEVHRAADLLATVRSTPSDLLLLDLQMERWSFADIEPLSKEVGIVVVTASERTEDALHAIRLGARAVGKDPHAAAGGQREVPIHARAHETYRRDAGSRTALSAGS